MERIEKTKALLDEAIDALDHGLTADARQKVVQARESLEVNPLGEPEKKPKPDNGEGDGENEDNPPLPGTGSDGPDY